MEEGEYGEFVELMLKVCKSLHDGAFGTEARGGGLACHEARILGCLSCSGRMSPSRIAELLGLSRPQLSVLADGLAARKLIERKRDEADRRIVWIRITPAGESMLRKSIAATGAHVRELLSPLSAAEVGEIKSSLERLAAALGGT